MTLEELFQRLSYGPLANLALSNEGAGGIIDAKKPSMVSFANDALVRLHTRFLLAERALIVRQMDGISNYHLVPENTFTASLVDNPPSTTPYIRDSLSRPFQDDLIKILRVYNSSGCEIRLNDDHHSSYNTPENHILQVPCPINDELTQVVYQAKHRKLSFNPANLNQTITLPSSLEEPLICYIAYLHYSSMNGQDNVARASEYLSRFNTICGEVEARGVVNTGDNNTNTKLECRGFA